eukprot:15450284-Alexandrium_andersonii.AAC.1
MSSPRLQTLRASGRLDPHLVHTPAAFPLVVANIYGWTGSEDKLQARANTEGMLEELLAEIS